MNEIIIITFSHQKCTQQSCPKHSVWIMQASFHHSASRGRGDLGVSNHELDLSSTSRQQARVAFEQQVLYPLPRAVSSHAPGRAVNHVLTSRERKSSASTTFMSLSLAVHPVLIPKPLIYVRSALQIPSCRQGPSAGLQERRHIHQSRCHSALKADAPSTVLPCPVARNRSHCLAPCHS